MENTIEERISEWEEKNKQKSIYVELFRAEILSLIYAIDNYLETHSEHPNAPNAPKCYESCIPILEGLGIFFKQELRELDKKYND